MTATNQSSILVNATTDDRVFRKVFRRLIWFLFILLVVSFMDRINIAFASLTMNKDLGLSAAAYGLSFTVFYGAYTLFEIPSNLMLAKVGARVWIARIMITWGLASAATMFVAGEWSLYGLRALVGAAEAGFFPGILLYLTYWFPRTCRARANALFIMGIPTTIAFASIVSGLILQMDGVLGLAGWRWLFLLEGLPAVGLGIVCLLYLVDSPAQAKWLSADEKREIEARLERDRVLEQPGGTQRGILSQLRSRNVLLLSAANFGLVTSLNANSTWVPQIVHGFAHGASYAVIGLLTAVPAILTVAAMPSWGASSDRRGERAWHLCIAMLLAAVGWLLVVCVDVPAVRYVGLILTSMGSFCGLLVFWTIPASAAILSPAARPAGIAFISCIGIGGGSALGPAVVGYLKDLTGTFTSGLLYVVAMLIMGVICITIVTAQTRVSTAVPSPSSA
jgi:ACS family 4-hydroxyphenylacetate permease-like MFS transporter